MVKSSLDGSDVLGVALEVEAPVDELALDLEADDERLVGNGVLAGESVLLFFLFGIALGFDCPDAVDVAMLEALDGTGVVFVVVFEVGLVGTLHETRIAFGRLVTGILVLELRTNGLFLRGGDSGVSIDCAGTVDSVAIVVGVTPEPDGRAGCGVSLLWLLELLPDPDGVSSVKVITTTSYGSGQKFDKSVY